MGYKINQKINGKKKRLVDKMDQQQFDQIKAWIWITIKRMAHSENDKEELFDHVLFWVSKAHNDYKEGIKPYKSWIIDHIRWGISDYYKIKKRQLVCTSIYAVETDKIVVKEEITEKEIETNETVLKILSMLKGEERLLIEQRYLEKRTFAKINIGRPITREGLRQKINRILKRVKKAIEHNETESQPK